MTQLPGQWYEERAADAEIWLWHSFSVNYPACRTQRRERSSGAANPALGQHGQAQPPDYFGILNVSTSMESPRNIGVRLTFCSIEAADIA